MALTAAARAPSCPVYLLAASFSPSLDRLFANTRWKTQTLPHREAAIQLIEQGDVPVILCDANHWRELLAAGRKSPQPVGVVVVTRTPDEAEYLEVVKSGAYYLPLASTAPEQVITLISLLWRSRHR